MWMEIKVVISGVGIIFIAIVISQIILLSVILGFLLFVAIFLIIFSDVIIGYKITRNRAKYLIDDPPPGFTTGVIFTLDNLIDFEWVRKEAHGKRDFVYNKREASVIDDGEDPYKLPNGSSCFLIHEKSAGNLNLKKVRYAMELNKEFGTNDIKEIYALAIMGDKKNGRSTSTD